MSELRTLIPYMLKYKKGLLLGLVFIIGTNIFHTLGPKIIGMAVDEISEKMQDMEKSRLIYLSSMLVGVSLIAGFFRFNMRNTIIGISRKVEFDYRNDFFIHLQNQQQKFYDFNRTGDLMSRATSDLNAVRMVAGPGIMYIVNSTMLFAVSMYYMINISPMLTLVALAPLPILTYLIRRFGKKIHFWFDKIQAQMATISSKAQENISGIRIIKAYAREKSEIRSFEKLNTEYVGLNKHLIKTWSMFYPIIQLISGFGFAIVLWYGGSRVIAGSITLGDFVAFNTYLLMLLWPVIAVGWVTNIFERGAASMKRLNKIMQTKVEITDDEADDSITDIEGEVEIRGLNFAYSNGTALDNSDPDKIAKDKSPSIPLPKGGSKGNVPTPAPDPDSDPDSDSNFDPNSNQSTDPVQVLTDINITIPKGKTAAILGHTGSGKSTLVNVIPRIYEPPKGTIFIDGKDVRNIPLKVLRENIGFVPQDTFLFSDTIKENISYGVKSLDETRLGRAVDISQLRENIEEFPDKFDTMLGERGINLSGGQKQRAAISRAIIREPKILILDDCLSSVDTKTEEDILHRLREVMAERTSIIISHRVSTIKDADMIYVLEDGKIVEQGDHEALLQENGIYADIFQKQLLSEELAGDI